MAVCTSYGVQGTENGVLFSERAYRANATKRGVIWCHGRLGHSYDYIAAPDPLMVALITAGFPVIATELAGTTAWGNAASVTAMANAYSQLKTLLGASTAAPLIVCYSMGTLPAFLWAASNPVAAIVGEAPVCDLAYMHDNNVNSWQAEIETAYGGSSGYTAAIGTHNPATQTASYAGIPSRLYYGNNGSGSDGTIPISTITAFASAVGSNCSTVDIGNISHANVPANVPVANAYGFLTSHA